MRCALLPIRATGAPAPGRWWMSTVSTLLIDTPPELRLQLIAAGRSHVDAVLYTHEHADHINGIDDLRIFSVKQRAALPVYGAPETLAQLQESFRYIFDADITAFEGTSKPLLAPHPLEAGRWQDVAGVPVLPLALPARPRPGLRVPDRGSGVHHGREGSSRGRARAVAGPQGPGAQRALVATRTQRTSVSARRSRWLGAVGAGAHLADAPDP